MSRSPAVAVRRGRSSSAPVVELPYTIPQDHTTFTLLRERSVDLWLHQLDRIEQAAGLAQCLSHPDPGYLGDPDKEALYAEFLDAVAARPGLWTALPREVAAWWRERDRAPAPAQPSEAGIATLGDDGSIALEREPASRTGLSDASEKRDLQVERALKRFFFAMNETSERLLIVSPVYNEGAHLARTGRAVALQVRRPDRWVIVDDGSSDDTLAVARRLERELDFVTVLEAPQDVPPGSDNLALARPVLAFNLGLEHAGWREYDFIGKLDGDVELPENWFADLLARFHRDERLGLTAGRLAEPGPRGWRLIPIPAVHVHGAVKLFRRECLEAIGGIPSRLGWDTIDETYARMRGFETHSYVDLVARHHRAWGSADGRLRGRARHGECAWVLHYGLAWVFLRSLKIARVPPIGASGVAFLYGYLRAAFRGVPRVDDRAFRVFVRRELRARMLKPLRIAPG